LVAIGVGRPVAAFQLFAPALQAPAGSKALGAPSPLQHIIFIVQENRSFDHYFGTFPGADGFPRPMPCLPDSWHPSVCDSPYLNHLDSNDGNAHGQEWQALSIDGGKMDGFVLARQKFLGPKCNAGNAGRSLPGSYVDDEGILKGNGCRNDVMGYHDGTDIPNYWAYASRYVLMDHFFESVASWSQPNHFEIFSGWSAKCTQQDPPDVSSCASSFGGDVWKDDRPMPDLWTDITYLLYRGGISWGVYLDGGQGSPFGQKAVPGIWNVLPGFETVQEDGQLANALLDQKQFYVDAAAGTLPQVTWLLPHYYDSEHPLASISHGQSYVTGLINAIMQGPDWSTSAIFVVYDDADGFYDHEPPPFNFDKLGLGIRVPAWMISPYAKPHYIDHQICSVDCYLKFIEDTFLNGERMQQAGRPDPRPDYRDAQPVYGDLRNDFDFGHPPQPPLVLPTHPMTMLHN
jgi:phospholipase C